jgi:hypothetical protein
MLARMGSMVVVTLALAGFGVGAVGVASASDTVVAFQTPSRGVGCMYSRVAGEQPVLRCDVRDVASPVARPAACELDYGSAFGLGASGKARRLCVGDTALDPHAKVLAYGRTRTLGPFTCVSRKTGLRCTTHAGHGFDLSRARQKLF